MRSFPGYEPIHEDVATQFGQLAVDALPADSGVVQERIHSDGWTYRALGPVALSRLTTYVFRGGLTPSHSALPAYGEAGFVQEANLTNAATIQSLVRWDSTSRTLARYVNGVAVEQPDNETLLAYVTSLISDQAQYNQTGLHRDVAYPSPFFAGITPGEWRAIVNVQQQAILRQFNAKLSIWNIASRLPGMYETAAKERRGLDVLHDGMPAPPDPEVAS